MEIFNEIKQNEDKEKQKFVHRNLAEVQRVRLEKLMKNPEKPVIIPELNKKDKEYNAPSFVRNVMGSSAGAGSGEFHVYRHLRRKEFARQKHLKMLSETERLNEEYQMRLEDNQMKADEKTSKKRAKRLKRKMKAKAKGKKPKLDGKSEEDKSDDEENSEGDENSDTKDEVENENSNENTSETPETLIENQKETEETPEIAEKQDPEDEKK